MNLIEINPLGSVESKVFRDLGYAMAPALLDPSLASFFWSYIHTKFASRLLAFGDHTVPNTPADYGDPTLEGLLEYLRPRVEQEAGLALYPTFSYVRLYKHGDALRRHRDRPACEISVSLNVGQIPDEPWPIYVENAAGPCAALLGAGDALLYRGYDCFHWREPYAGQSLAQVFLHYVARNGPYAAERFDGR
ncbi:MAG: hypothetical protein ACRECV_19530 [Xanthobacteraceae bacterium]